MGWFSALTAMVNIHDARLVWPSLFSFKGLVFTLIYMYMGALCISN